jgi:hypothetical protein
MKDVLDICITFPRIYIFEEDKKKAVYAAPYEGTRKSFENAVKQAKENFYVNSFTKKQQSNLLNVLDGLVANYDYFMVGKVSSVILGQFDKVLIVFNNTATAQFTGPSPMPLDKDLHVDVNCARFELNRQKPSMLYVLKTVYDRVKRCSCKKITTNPLLYASLFAGSIFLARMLKKT